MLKALTLGLAVLSGAGGALAAQRIVYDPTPFITKVIPEDVDPFYYECRMMIIADERPE